MYYTWDEACDAVDVVLCTTTRQRFKSKVPLWRTFCFGSCKKNDISHIYLIKPQSSVPFVIAIYFSWRRSMDHGYDGRSSMTVTVLEPSALMVMISVRLVPSGNTVTVSVDVDGS